MTNTLPDMARDGGTCPSREFLVQQAVLNATKIYQPHNLRWCTAAEKLDCYTSTDRTYVRADLVTVIRAEFRSIASRYQGMGS